MQRIAELVERKRLHVEFEIRRRMLARAAGEAAQLARGHRQRPGAQKRVLEPHHHLSDHAVGTLIQRDGVAHLEDGAQLQVILQVLADAGQLVHHVDTVLSQQRRRTDAGQLHDLRRADAAGRKDRLQARFGERALAAVCELDATAALAIHAQAHDVRIGDDGQVRALDDRTQKGLRGVPAHAALLVDHEESAAFVIAAIEIIGARNAGLHHRLAVVLQNFPREPLRLDPPLPSGTVRRVRAVKIILALAEHGQDGAPAPRGVSSDPRPFVVVARLAAQVEHRVDRRAAAKHFAARIKDRSSVQARVRLSSITPVGARVANAVEITDRNVDPDPVVARARLEQQHLDLRIGRKPVGEHAAGSSCTRDYVIELHELTLRD